MSKKVILTSAVVVAAALANTVYATPKIDTLVAQKQIQAGIISNAMGNLVQTVNSPECTVHPSPSRNI